jgi:MFS family permease
VIGGILTQHLSWHWIFLINIPIGCLGILFAARIIPGDEPGGSHAAFDYPGAVTLFSAMALCTVALEEGTARGMGDPLIPACIALCLLCTALFVTRELNSKNPLINIRIFTSWKFTSVLGAFLIMNIIFAGVLYLLPFYLTTMMQFDPATTGLYLLIPPAIIALISVPFGKWSDRYGRRWFTVAACGCIVIYNMIFAALVPSSGIMPLLTSLVLTGVAVGIYSGPAASRIIDHAPGGEEGTGSSLMVTTIYFGGVLGTAVYAAIFTLATADAGRIAAFSDLDPALFLSGFHVTMAAGIVPAIIALALSVIVPDGKMHRLP